MAWLGRTRGTRRAWWTGGRVFGAAHVGAEQEHDDGCVEYHDDLRQRQTYPNARDCWSFLDSQSSERQAINKCTRGVLHLEHIFVFPRKQSVTPLSISSSFVIPIKLKQFNVLPQKSAAFFVPH